jgi:hypothetical protein
MRLDDAGENKKLKTRSDSAVWKLNITFEFTARDTPQQNHLAELGFEVLANRGRAVMHAANVPLLVRCKVWREAFKTATLLDGLMPIDIGGVVATRHVHWGGKNPAFAKHLKTWGKAGTVKLKIKATPKVADRGAQCMFVGCAIDQHEGDCYHMWDPNAKRVHESMDITWLHRMFFQKSSPASDLAIEPIEHKIAGKEAREGVDMEETTDKTQEAMMMTMMMAAGLPPLKKLSPLRSP